MTEASNAHGIDAAALEAEIAKRLSALLSEKPDEAAIASELLRVYLCENLAIAQADLFLQKRKRDADVPASGDYRVSGIDSNPDGSANTTISPPAPMAPRIDPAVAAHLNNALSTLIAQRPSAAVPEILRLQAALREHEQIPVIITDVPEATSTQAPPNTEQPEPTINARVQHLFKPFTMSVTLKVHIDGHSEPAFLKLFDRRFSPILRVDDEVPAWTSEREANYHNYIRSGEAEKFIDYLNGDDSNEELFGEDKFWTVRQDEAFLQDKSHDLYKAELAAYRALLPLQSICVPKLLATVIFQPFPDADPEIQRCTAIHGLLLSYIPGFTLDNLARHVPRNQWQAVCDDAVRAVNACSELGILNEDVRSGNCIVRCVTKTNGAGDIIYRPFIIDFEAARLRRPDESDEEWTAAKREVNEEGAMGAVLMRDLARLYGLGGYVYDRSRDYRRLGNEVLAGSGHAEGEEMDVYDEEMDVYDEEMDVYDEEMEMRGREGSPVYPQAVLVDEHDDLDDPVPYVEELALERPWTEADGGFRRAYPLSAAEAQAIGINAPYDGH